MNELEEEMRRIWREAPPCGACGAIQERAPYFGTGTTRWACLDGSACLDRQKQRTSEACSYCGGTGTVGDGTAYQPYELCHVCRPRMNEAQYGGCPCLHTTPCDPRCTCISSASSFGCRRCCSYGSPEQQKAAAARLCSETPRSFTAEELREFAKHCPEWVCPACAWPAEHQPELARYRAFAAELIEAIEKRNEIGLAVFCTKNLERIKELRSVPTGSTGERDGK